MFFLLFVPLVISIVNDATVGHTPEEPPREKERPPPPRGLEPDSLLFYFGKLDEREGIFTQDGASLAFKIFDKLGNEAKDKPWNDAAMKPFVDAGVAVLSEALFFPSELQQYMDIVDNKRTEEWGEEARKLRQQHLQNADEQLQRSIQKPPSLSLKKVVQSVQSTSTKSPKFVKPLEHFRTEFERFKWEERKQRLSALVSIEEQVEEANGIYQHVSALKGQERKFRPVQLVAIYTMAKMANDGERIVAQMKTGEGKTDVCAAIASILARSGRFSAIHIITSGEANAKKDFMATKDYIKAATGHDPILASDGIPWNEESQEEIPGRIVYCQITDIMKSLVQAMQNSRLDKIQKFLSRSYALVDEADFVMFEQGSNQLYVSSAVQGYTALMPFLFRAAGLLDYHAEYDPAQIKTQTEVGGKIGYFIDHLKEPLKKLEGSIRKHDGTWSSSVPSMVDKDGKFVSIAQGALQARLKLSDQDYVVTRNRQGGADHAEITIVNLANGEEAYGSRWINEGPFAEVQQGLPIQGMEPIAFFASVQLALMAHGGFGGITGTVGNSACLDFLAKHFSISGLYRFPRNTPTMMYWLDAQEAMTTKGQHRNIFESVLNFNKGEMTGSQRYGVPKQPSAELKGPVEIVFKTIQECKAFEAFLREDGRGDGFHVIPFYRSSIHSMLEGPVPTNTIIIASNMGGRGLDIKLQKPDVLLVILTQVLDDRQDMQARGRCGRNGKPGVIQYQLLKSSPGKSNEDVTVTLVKSKYFSGVKADQELQSRSPLLQKDMKATKVLESFSTTRMPYIQGWLEKLFAGLSLKQDAEPLVKGLLKHFITSLYDKRWACWKDSSSPRREESHALPDFRRTYHLSNPVDLGEGRIASDLMEELARRLYTLCYVLRLDAAEATELASTLLRIEGEKWLLMLSAKLLLHASGNESPPWPSKFAGEQWQPDWTGKAGLLLAMVSPEYRSVGLLRSSAALKRLEEHLHKIPDLQTLAGNRGKQLQDKVHRDIRPFYPVQLQLKQEQVKHLRRQVDRLVGAGHFQLESLQMSLAKEAFSVDGMSISVKDLRHLMGQKWTEAIFSVRPAAIGWASPRRKGDFKEWTKHLEMVGQDGQDSDGARSSGGGGGGGPNQRMEAQTSEQSQEVETAMIQALNENSADTDIKGFQDEFQASSVQADFSNMDIGSGYFSTTLAKFREKIPSLQATSSWFAKMGSYAQEAWTRTSEAAKDASWFKAKESQGEEKKQEVLKEAHRLMQEEVAKYNEAATDVLDREFPRSSHRSETFGRRVEADGNKKDTRSKAEIKREAEAEEDAAQFYAFDKDASADVRFLQAHALAAIKKDLARQPGGEELAETMDELERLNSALAQKAQDAKLAGKELCSDQEAQTIQQAYVNVLRAALEVMKFADETGLSSVSQLWDKANTIIWRKNQEGLQTSWIGWIFCPFSRWNYVEARNAFERFEKWGDSPLFNAEEMPDADKLLLFNIQKFASSGILMSQRLRRRRALQEFTNANWFEAWWNPSYRIQLGNSLSAAALDQLSENELQQILEIQALQDRANTEYLRHWQQTQTVWQFLLIGLSILIAIISFFTGGLALAALALVAAVAQLVLAVLMNNVEDRTDLTREAKKQLSNICSFVMSLVGLLHLGLSSVSNQVAQKVAEWLTKLANYMRMLQAALASPFLMQAFSRLTSSDQFLQQGDGTLWGSLAAAGQLVMDWIGLANTVRPHAVPAEEEGPTRRPGRRPEDGGQDDVQRNNDAMEHDTDGNHGWTLAGALTALGSMLRSLVRERTRTNEASKREREPKKEELSSAKRNQEVRRRDLKADGEIHASLTEEKIELQVQNDACQGATMCIEEHGRKVLQMENGQFQYARKKIDPNLQRDIMQNKGFKEDEDFYVSNDGIAHLMGESEAVDKHGADGDLASWNNFVSLLLALEKMPESDRSKFTRLVMEKAFSREKTPTSQEVASKRISSYLVKADDAGMKAQRSDELELSGDGSSLHLKMSEDEVASEAGQGSTSIQVDNANLKVSSQGIESSGTLPKENAKLLFNMLNQDAENLCLDAEAVEEMVNSLHDEVNLEQMAEALHSAEAKAQPTSGGQAAERQASQDENPERAQISKRAVVESFVAKLRRLMEKSETPESNLEINAVVKLANKIFPGKNLGEELAKELVEGQVHFVPKELIEKKNQFSADQKLSVYHSIMYLLERQQGYDKEEAKKRVESLDKGSLVKQFLSSFVSEMQADNPPARESASATSAASAASEPTTVQKLEEKLKDNGLEIQYGLKEGVESTLQDLVAKSDIEGLDNFLKDFLDKSQGQDLVDAVSDIEPLVGKALEEQRAHLQQCVEELKASIHSGDGSKSAQTVLDDMKRYVGSAKVSQKAQGVRWWIEQVSELLKSIGAFVTEEWERVKRAEELVTKGVDYREIVNLMENLGFKEGVDYRTEEHQGAFHMYPVATGDSLHTSGQDNFCVQRTLAVLLAQKENPNLSFDALKELASDPAEINKMNKVLAENGVLQEQHDFNPVGRSERPDFSDGVRKLFKNVANKFGVEKYDIAHGLSWSNIKNVIDDWRGPNGDDAKFEDFLTNFKKPNSMVEQLEELGRKAEGDQKSKIEQTIEEYEKILRKQQEEIGSLWDKVKRKKAEGQLNEESRESLEDLKKLEKLLHDFVGNLRPGDAKDNRSIGAKIDPTTDQNGDLTPRSKWVDEVFGSNENYQIHAEGVKSSQIGRRFILAKRIASLAYKAANRRFTLAKRIASLACKAAKKRAKDASARLRQQAKDAVGKLQRKAKQAKDKAKDAVGKLQRKAKQAKDKAKDVFRKG